MVNGVHCGGMAIHRRSSGVVVGLAVPTVDLPRCPRWDTYRRRVPGFGCSDHTIASVRREQKSGAQIPHLDRSIAISQSSDALSMYIQT